MALDLIHNPRNPHHPLLPAELVAVLRANDPDLFKRWFCAGIQALVEPAVTELVLDRHDPFITRVERGRIVAWHLGMIF